MNSRLWCRVLSLGTDPEQGRYRNVKKGQLYQPWNWDGFPVRNLSLELSISK